MVYLSISEVLDRAWELVKKYGVILVIVYFVLSFLQSAIGRLMAPPVDADALMAAIQSNNYDEFTRIYLSNPFGSIVVSIIGAILFLGLYNSMLLLAKGVDNEVLFSHWKLDLSVYVKYVAVNILTGLIVGIGFICCLLPGFFLYARLGYAKIHALDCPNDGILDHIQASWEITRGNTMTIIGLVIVQFFILIVGLAICCVGILPAAVLTIFMDIVAYLILTRYFEKKQDEENV